MTSEKLRVWTITPQDCMGLTAPIQMVEKVLYDQVVRELEAAVKEMKSLRTALRLATSQNRAR